MEPDFDQIPAICIGGNIDLPTVSKNGIKGVWSPEVNNRETTEYIFTPDDGQCADVAKMTVVVNNEKTKPEFDQIPAICIGGTFDLGNQQQGNHGICVHSEYRPVR